jgi:RNA polymerase sigma-70 factor (ECF subfamily)
MNVDPSETVVGPSHAGTTSSRLLQRLRVRDSASWQRLTAVYGPLVYYWCHRYGLKSQDAADVFQEVFAAVWSGIAEFEHGQQRGRFRGWLWTITRNKISDQYRQRAGRLDAAGGSGNDLGQVAMPEQPPDDESDEDHRRELTGLVRRAVEAVRAEFEPSTWDAFWRVVVDCQRVAEVACALEISPGAVRQAKWRVLRRLREEMEDILL